MRKIAVIGIGNLLLRDDGVGVEVVNRLAGTDWPANVSLIDGGTAILHLLDVFIENDKIIIIDCLRGGQAPGTIYRLTPEELGAWCWESLSLHDVQVLDVFNMATLFGHYPEVIIYGIEPHTIELKLGLTELVESRLPVLLKLVRGEILGSVANGCLRATLSRGEEEGFPVARSIVNAKPL